jgi:ElaB/YqjD/DUF883 family membrane-anchored ribosome-binding protein
MKNNKQATQSPQEILDELHSLVADAEKMVGEAVSEHSEDAISSLRSRYEAAQERLSEVYDRTKKKVVAGAKYADETIRENPYQSVAVAAGVGLLVGLLIGRRFEK